jgi:hypothetical protein
LKPCPNLTDPTYRFGFRIAEIVNNDNSLATIEKFDARLTADTASAARHQNGHRPAESGMARSYSAQKNAHWICSWMIFHEREKSLLKVRISPLVFQITRFRFGSFSCSLSHEIWSSQDNNKLINISNML